jgi:signal transduction histidine kinase
MKLAQAAVENLASQKNIQLTLPDDAQLNGLLSPNESAPPLKLRIKDYQLYLVFSNLLQNAVKYSPDNSRVEASWRLAQPGEAPSCQDGYFSPTKRYVVFSVTDHGIGIPQAERKKVRQGERGSNAKAAGIPGTGHGLMRLELMLAQVGGQVDIESPIHADSASPGSRISCWIPLE